MSLGTDLVSLDIKNGYCAPVLAELEDLLVVQGPDYRRTGFIEAVTSERNIATQRQSELLKKFNAGGTPIESIMRFYPNLCSKTINAKTDICTTGSTAPARQYKDLVAGSTFTDSEKWTISPTDANLICGENVRSIRARQMADSVRLIVENTNKYFLSLAYAHAGGIYDHVTKTVSAAGVAQAFNILGKTSQPNAKAFLDMSRLFDYNGASTPFVVTSDNAFFDYIRFRNADAYALNQDGIELGNIDRLLGLAPYIDNSGGLATVIADGYGTVDTSVVDHTSAIAWEPGAIRVRDSHDGIGDNTWMHDITGKTTFVGPYGLTFDYQFYIDPCNGHLTEQVSLSTELFCKPLGLNDCELAGTNGIFHLDFDSCAEDACA